MYEKQEKHGMMPTHVNLGKWRDLNLRNMGLKSLYLSIFLISMILLFPIRVESTTVLIVIRNGQIFIGADGKQTGFFSNGTREEQTVCKILKYGNIAVLEVGGTRAEVRLPNSKKPVVLFDVSKEADKALRRPGNLEQKANAIQTEFWAFYEHIWHDFYPTAPDKQIFYGQFGRIYIALAGKGESGTPKVIELRFTATPHGEPHEERAEISKERDHFYLGWTEAVDLTPFDPFAMGDVEKTMTQILQQEAKIHPFEIGPPYSLARVTKRGIVFDQLGACASERRSR